MPIASPEPRWHDSADVGIVGAGGCGLSAALAAVHRDLKVVVWEKAKAAGGCTALADGAIPAAGTRLQRDAGLVDTAEDFARDVLAYNGGRSDSALTGCVCNASAALVEWLVDSVGIPLELERYMLRSGHRQYRMHAVAGNRGQVLIENLLRRVERQLNLTVRLATPVLQVWYDAFGAIIGVQVKPPKKGPINVRCGAVVLACGGFGANTDLVAQYCPAIAGATYAGIATAQGDALQWGRDVGAATECLDAFSAHPAVAVGSNYMLPSALLTCGAILVNQRGQRFTDESDDPGRVTQQVRAQPGHLAYEVFDIRTLKLVQAHDPHFGKEIVPRTLRRGADLSDLAKQFQLDGDELQRTIDAYNGGLGHGPDGFGRVLTGEPMVAPFYGARVTGALLSTQGGLKIDTSARVVRPDGAPIANLYAGGGAAVGLSGPGGEGHLPGMGLLCALVWGRIAGEEAARAVVAALAITPDEAQLPAEPIPS